MRYQPVADLCLYRACFRSIRPIVLISLNLPPTHSNVIDWCQIKSELEQNLGAQAPSSGKCVRFVTTKHPISKDFAEALYVKIKPRIPHVLFDMELAPIPWFPFAEESPLLSPFSPLTKIPTEANMKKWQRSDVRWPLHGRGMPLTSDLHLSLLRYNGAADA